MMNVLEKILEEIEDRIKISDDCNENLAFIDGIRYGLIEAKKIIRSHMDNGKDENVPTKIKTVEEEQKKYWQSEHIVQSANM